ncbi:MAG TPA: ImmA/IrrE family metallo-endopeptidase [Thermoanaerobaculia bacterium]|nr:ImmA/IrrE family metallo-endopeptidase [Thermoanaerobaculia bacterium]
MTKKPARKSYDDLAEELLRDMPARPPTPLRALFPKFRIKDALPSPLLRTAGKLTAIDDSFIILYASNLAKNRVEFTIAHELAHAVFDQHSDMPKLEGDTLERACDRLAAALLMPKRAFTTWVGTPSIRTITVAARDFNVSMQTAAARCEELTDTSMFRLADGAVEWKTRLAPFDDPAVKRLVRAAFEENVLHAENIFLTNAGRGGFFTFEAEVAKRGEGTFLLRRQPSRTP